MFDQWFKLGDKRSKAVSNTLEVNLTNIQNDLSLIVKQQEKIIGVRMLDLLFFVDCTGSMSSWITKVKEEINKIMDFLTASTIKSDIKMSFIGYRDYCDSDRFEIAGFTNDANYLKNFISNVCASGGGDTPEDIAGGLKKVMEQRWRPEASKYMIMIADAPCHGRKYHTCGDDDPDGDRYGIIPENIIKEMAKQKIIIYAIKINSITDQMYRIFNDAYQLESDNGKPITYLNLGQSTQQLADIIKTTANDAINNNLKLDNVKQNLQNIQNKNGSESEKQQVNELLERIKNSEVSKTKKEPVKDILKQTVNSSKTFDQFYSAKSGTTPLQCICHFYNGKNIPSKATNWENPAIAHYSSATQVFVDDTPFKESKEEYFYYLFDKEHNKKSVATRNKENCKEDIKSASMSLAPSIICHRIAKTFNNRVINMLNSNQMELLMKFENKYIYECQKNKDENIIYFVEDVTPGEYSSSAKNPAEQLELFQAFSHFSYQYTNGFLMITNLSGVGEFTRSDQIHCRNPNLFGEKNEGYFGMIKFFTQHRCNKYCNALKLINVMEGNKEAMKGNKKLKEFYDLDEASKPENPDRMTKKMCDLCRNHFEIQEGKAYEVESKGIELFCDNCENKRNSSFKTIKCERCHKEFKVSDYIAKMKRLSIPKKCYPCAVRYDRLALYIKLYDEETIKEQGVENMLDPKFHSSDPTLFYDLVIDVNSLADLQKQEDKVYGWKVKAQPEGYEQYEENKKETLSVIGVIGQGNRGKSFMLSQISDMVLPTGYSVTTQGLSIKYPTIRNNDKSLRLIVLDSAGSDPAIKETENVKLDYDLDSGVLQKQIAEVARDKQMTEHFLQNFIIYHSNIVLLVVGQLTYSEQKLYNKIKKILPKSKQLFVVHNLMNFTQKSQVENYLQNILLKTYMFKLQPQNFVSFGGDANTNKIYYVEPIEGNRTVITHLIVANNSHDSESGKFYNPPVLNFLKMQLVADTKPKKFDIKNALYKFLSKSSVEMFENEISVDDIEEQDNVIYLKSDLEKPHRLKKIMLNELGNFSFDSLNYTPSYSCWLETIDSQRVLIIQIEVAGPKPTKIEMKYKILEGVYVFRCKGTKTGQVPSEVLTSNFRQGEFNLVFKVDTTIGLIKEKKSAPEFFEKNGKYTGVVQFKYNVEEDKEDTETFDDL